MTSNCHTFFVKKLQKSVTIWEHLPKRYYFWTIIKQKKRQKCDNLRSWTVLQNCKKLTAKKSPSCSKKTASGFYKCDEIWNSLSLLELDRSADSRPISTT